ncbi:MULTISPECIES: gluconokinase [Peribacillus]|uniref:Gluconokinase n=1 Tax=Peribacillus simplex TaxID=1478 RepID=A0A120GQ98_9BACI|nr:gluconokinase [Peribacillus simplex]KWW20986.1 gluconokinase [Peribacillus simplex]
MAGYMMGIDIGTTSTKVVLFSKGGEVVQSCSKGYPLHSPTPSVAEQDPEEIYKAVILAIAEVMIASEVGKDELGFLSFSSAMHSLIAMGKDGRPLTNSMTWADNRSVAYAEQLKASEQGMQLYHRTGTPIHPMSPITKIMWLRNEHPDIFEDTYKFIGIKEYIFYKFFNEYVMDHSLASATGMFNLNELKWDEEALSIAGIDADRLPALVPTTQVLSGLSTELAAAMNIQEGTPFVIGASDGVLANLGQNAIKPGVLAITVGTSGAVRTVSDRPLTDPKGRTFCYALTENHWVIGGPVNNGGITFRWARDQFGRVEIEKAKASGLDSYEILTDMASTIAPGSDGLIFHPYMAGERAPLWSADARGSFFGLALHHTRDHMVRAVLEGVMYNLYSVLLAVRELAGAPEKIHASGGFVRSKLWRQIMADVFNQNVTIPESFESSSLGAAVLGLYALGEIESLDEVEGMIGDTDELVPIEANVKVYEELMSIYLSVSRQLEADYSRIAEFQRRHLE